MQRLEKTVLRTAADTTPDHRPGDISHRAAIDAYRLAEALHHQLLKVIGQEAEALVVGQYRLAAVAERVAVPHRSEEHTSELQSLMRISYAVFCLKKKNIATQTSDQYTQPTHDLLTQNHAIATT